MAILSKHKLLSVPKNSREYVPVGLLKSNPTVAEAGMQLKPIFT